MLKILVRNKLELIDYTKNIVVGTGNTGFPRDALTEITKTTCQITILVLSLYPVLVVLQQLIHTQINITKSGKKHNK